MSNFASPYILDNNNMASTGTKYYSCQIGFTTFNIDSRYQNLLPQGDSAYGCVVSAYDTLMNRMVAIKKVRDPLSQLHDMKRILRELKLLRHFLGHENISSVYDIMTDPPDNPQFNDVYIVTNLFDCDLDQVIKSTETLTDHHHQFFIYQTLRALKYIHSANVIHRDLKPSNLLITSECDLAICDFGLGRGMNETAHDPLTQYVVTRWYRAPELLCRSPYNQAVDMWSLGCIFAEMLTKAPFFTGDNAHQQLKSILNKLGCPPRSKLNFIKSKTALTSIVKHKAVNTRAHFSLNFPEGTNFLGLDLLKRMLQFNPNDRITVDDAIRHPFLRAFHDPRKEPVCSTVFDFHCVSPAAVAAWVQQQQERRQQLQQQSSLLLLSSNSSSMNLANLNENEEASGGGVVNNSNNNSGQEPQYKKHRVRSVSPSPFVITAAEATPQNMSSSASSSSSSSSVSDVDVLSAVSAMIFLSASGSNNSDPITATTPSSSASFFTATSSALASSSSSSSISSSNVIIPQSLSTGSSTMLATIPEGECDENIAVATTAVDRDNMSVSVVDEEQQQQQPVHTLQQQVQQQKLNNRKSTTSTGSSSSSSHISSSSSITSTQFQQEVTSATTSAAGAANGYNDDGSLSNCDLTKEEARVLVLREVMWYRPVSPNIATFLASTGSSNATTSGGGSGITVAGDSTDWNQVL